MAERPRILVCSCEDTMPLDVEAVRLCCRGTKITAGRQLCRTELAHVQEALAGDAPVLIACTQEAPLFSELATEVQATAHFVNIRENAGWSNEAAEAGAKMAALIAAAREPEPEVATVNLRSEGVTLIYGKDERALEAAELLKDQLAVTVLLKPPVEMLPPSATRFALLKGRVRTAKGTLGHFELTLDDYAAPQPSSRDGLAFGPPRQEVPTRCDILLDLSGEPPLFAAADLRDGYLRADPGDPAASLRAVLKARELSGTFEKPLYVDFSADLCAHARARIVGCRRCLDLCPTGAIAPAGDSVVIDPRICAGCGQCAATCPTGAAAYALPPPDTLLRKLRALLTAYRQAGGEHPVLLLHDGEHGSALIEALARFGDGLPANVLPLQVNEITQVGLETIAAAFAYGARAVRLLSRAQPRHDSAGLQQTIALAAPILAGLGFAGARIAGIETDDPDVLGDALRAIEPMEATARPASFSTVGGKRDLVRLALRELHAAAPAPADVVPLPQGAPFGSVEVGVEGCTLCLACVPACPTGALSDDPERPILRFAEDACVQCGLCAATCPEKVISLKPQLDFSAATAGRRVIKEEEPFLCVACGKPFGVKSSVERVTTALAGKHWMFKGAQKRLDVIRMCTKCRVAAMLEDKLDPFAAPPRPLVRTTEDYLRERAEEKGEG